MRDVAAFLGDITRESLAIHADTTAMIEAGVYKMFAGRTSTEELLDETTETLARLRSLYTSAANHGEGMLVVFE